MAISLRLVFVTWRGCRVGEIGYHYWHMKRMVWVMFVFGCDGKSSGLPEEPPERSGQWYATDLHVHSAAGSNDADPSSTVAAHAEVAKSRGLSLIAITDHSNSAGSMDCETGDVEDCPNQGPEFPSRAEADAVSDASISVVVGVEVSPVASLETTMVPTGHVGCLPRPGDPFSDVTSGIVDRPVGDVLGGDGVVWCNENGGLSVINHPYAPTAWVAYDWTDMNYDAVEVFNGSARFDPGDAQAVRSWACDVAQGKGTAPVGGSDTHRADTESPPPGILDQALGFPTTWVWAESGDVESVLSALVAGQTVVSDPRTQLDVLAWNEGGVAGPGASLNFSELGAVVRVQAEVEHSGLILQVVDLKDGSCTRDTRSEDGSTPVLDLNVLFEKHLAPNESIETEFIIEELEQHRIAAWILPVAESYLAHDGVAIAAPIELLPQ